VAYFFAERIKLTAGNEPAEGDTHGRVAVFQFGMPDHDTTRDD